MLLLLSNHKFMWVLVPQHQPGLFGRDQRQWKEAKLGQFLTSWTRIGQVIHHHYCTYYMIQPSDCMDLFIINLNKERLCFKNSTWSNMVQILQHHNFLSLHSLLVMFSCVIPSNKPDCSIAYAATVPLLAMHHYFNTGDGSVRLMSKLDRNYRHTVLH